MAHCELGHKMDEKKPLSSQLPIERFSFNRQHMLEIEMWMCHKSFCIMTFKPLVKQIDLSRTELLYHEEFRFLNDINIHQSFLKNEQC